MSKGSRFFSRFRSRTQRFQRLKSFISNWKPHRRTLSHSITLPWRHVDAILSVQSSGESPSPRLRLHRSMCCRICWRDGKFIARPTYGCSAHFSSNHTDNILYYTRSTEMPTATSSGVRSTWPTSGAAARVEAYELRIRRGSVHASEGEWRLVVMARCIMTFIGRVMPRRTTATPTSR